MSDQSFAGPTILFLRNFVQGEVSQERNYCVIA